MSASSTFLVLVKLLSKMVNPIFIPSAASDSSNFPTSYPKASNINLLMFADAVGVKWHLIVLSQFLSLIPCEFEHFLLFTAHLSFLCFLLPFHLMGPYFYIFYLLTDGCVDV